MMNGSAMDDNLEEKIIQCLEALENGQTIDRALSLFPGDEESLRPVLEVAGMLSDLRVAHTVQAQSNSRQRFLERAEALQRGAEPDRPTVGFWRRLLYPLAFLTMLVLIMGGGTFLASRTALPGDVLYGTKLTIEGIRLSLVRDLQVQDRLREEFHEERLLEIRTLLVNGRQADVILDGTIEAIADNNWQVAGIPVQISDLTTIDGTPDIGAEVQIKGRTNLNKVEAQEIIVEVVNQPAPEPTITPVISRPSQDDGLQTTPESVPSGNQPILNTPTPTATETPSPTPTATATPTSTPTPNPSSTPPITDDNNNSGPGNTNDNTNTNDNDGGGNTNNNDDDDNNNESGGGNTNTNNNDNNNDNTNINNNDNDNDNTNTNDNNNDNDNDNDNNSGPGGGDNDNENDNNSGPGGGGNTNNNDNDNNSGPGGFTGLIAS
ncbi:MAG: DUF5667 domain-containing protein [Candidatus Promineifilaceae bacterium]